MIVAHVSLTVKAATVVLHDPSGKILLNQAKPSSVTQAAGTGALCAATALVPPYNIADEAAQQVRRAAGCQNQGLKAAQDSKPMSGCVP